MAIKETIKEGYMYLLGTFVMGVAFAAIAMIISVQIPQANHDIVVMAVGVLLGWATNVVGYFYGSSKTSADKTQMLLNSTPITTDSKTEETK
jgi:drug/metabolite transporter (DMT)-like permease